MTDGLKNTRPEILVGLHDANIGVVEPCSRHIPRCNLHLQCLSTCVNMSM